MFCRIFIWILYFSCLNIDVESACGDLNFTEDNVLIGGTTDLVYTPNVRIHIPAMTRVWVIIPHMSRQPVAVFRSDSDTLLANVKEVQSQVRDDITLHISNVSYGLIGRYILRFFNGPNHVCDSGYATLTVKPMSVSECGEVSVVKSRLVVGELAQFTFRDSISRTFEWQRDVGDGYNSLPLEERFETNSLAATKYYLFISETMVTDSGGYRVRCPSGYSNVVRLEISPTTPSKPLFRNVKSIHSCSNCIAVYKDKTATISCSSENGSKPISLLIYMNGRLIDASITEQNQQLVAEYQFTPTSGDINTYFTCAVKNGALTVPLVTNVSVYLYIVPDAINIQVPTLIKENESQTIVCTTLKGRPPVKPDIFFNAFQINSSMERNITPSGDTYTVVSTFRKTFTRRDNQGTIHCGLVNKHFRSHLKDKIINVLFPPLSADLTEVRKTSRVNGDTYLELRLAVAASNPRSKVKWEGIANEFVTYTERYLNDSETKGQWLSVDVSMNLTRADNNRKLKATVMNKMFPEMSRLASYVISITYAPVITTDEGIDTKTVFEGDDVILTCDVDSNPLSRVSWYDETGVIKKTGQHKTLYLQLINITMDETQTFTCVAHNNKGSANKSILILVKEASEKPLISTGISASIIGPLVGGIVVVVAAALIGGLVFYLMRKRRTECGEGLNALQIKVEDRKPSAQPIMNEPVYSNMDKTKNNVTNEQQIYATVIPKDQRPIAGGEDKQVHTSNGYRNEDGLLYADLEIHHDTLAHTNKPVTKTEEATQYVTVDFSKTGILEIHDIPDEDGPTE